MEIQEIPNYKAASGVQVKFYEISEILLYRSIIYDFRGFR